MTTDEINALSNKVIGAAFEVRKELRFYYREQFYKLALLKELQLQGIKAETEVPMIAYYKGIPLIENLRADIIVEDEIIIETKALHMINEDNLRQLSSYLHVMDMRLGFLINFGVRDFRVATSNNFNNLKQGIYRMANSM